MIKIATAIAALALTLSAQAQPLPKDKAVTEGRLANGMTYFIRHNSQTPGQADFYIANRVGSILEEPEQRGLAHFLEHMAFNGTEHFPDGNGGKNSIRNWCERNGIKFGADLNASTAIERTLYNIANAPVNKEGVTDTCLLILSDWSHALLLRDNEIDQERGVIHEEWRTRRANRAIQRLMEDAMPTMYQGSKYADCLPIGSIEVVDTFRHEDLRRYYRKWYRPDLQAVIVVGDIDVADVERKIKKFFGNIPAAAPDAAERIYYPVPDNQKTISYVVTDEEQPTLNFSMYMKRNSSPRSQRATREAFADDYKSRLAMFILRQRLSDLTMAEHPLVLSASCRDGSFFITDEKDAFSLNIGLFPDRIQEGINEVFSVVENARKHGFTEAELEHAKLQHNVNLEHRVDNKDKERNREYVGQIINHFCNATHLMSIEDEAEIEHSLMESVTLDDVNNALKEIVLAPESTAPSNRVITVYGPTTWNKKPFVMPTEKQFEQWVANAEKRDYENKEYKAVDRTFMKKLPKKGKILAKNSFSNGYTEYILSNGMKVYGRASDIEPNRLTIKMFRAGGQSLYPDSDVPSLRMLQTVVRTSGAADFDFLTLEKKRAGKALRVIPFIDSEEEGVKGVCAASDFKTWLQIAHLYITQPRRDDKIFNSIIERQRSILKNREASPNVVFNDSIRTTLYDNTQRSMPITLECLDSVSNDRIYQIYKERFANMAGMNLIVTGDIRTDEFEELLCQYVASLPGKANKKNEPRCGKYLLDIKRGDHKNVFTYKQKTPSAITNIIYSYTSNGEAYNADNDLKADFLAQIMRGIYTETVREEKGGTYGVSVSSQGWKLPTEGISMTVNFRCDPNKFDELLPIIDEQLEKMAQNGPTEEQLNKVKEYEIKNYKRAVETNGWWEYLCYHVLAENIDFGKDYEKKVNDITCSDIQDFCKLLLSQKNRIQVTMRQ